MNNLKYLNNCGSRWVNLPKQKMFILDPITNEILERTPKYFESFGNFASVAYSYKGKTKHSLNYCTAEDLAELQSKQEYNQQCINRIKGA